MADLNYSPMRIHQYGFTYLSNWWNYSEEEVTSAFWRADFLRDHFDGKKVRICAEINWDGGKNVEIGVLEFSAAK